MFNLKNHSTGTTDLLKSELSSFDIIINPTGTYEIQVGDEKLESSSFQECLQYIKQGTNELKQRLGEEWRDLQALAETIIHQDGSNSGGVENIYFLNSVKKSYLLSILFSDLADISGSIRKLFDADIRSIPKEFILKFNHLYLRIKLIHQLVMRELYRVKLIKRYMSLHKAAQISGPWANLDLPMQERVWEWDDSEDEYFTEREKQRKEQTRYNPENLKNGFFYVWQDLNRDPYKFEDMKTDSPYKSRLLMTVP